MLTPAAARAFTERPRAAVLWFDEDGRVVRGLAHYT